MMSKYNAIKVRFKDGKACRVRTPSSALLVWYIAQGRYGQKKDAKKILPYHPQFAVLVVAALERTFNATPGLDLELLEPDWYKDLPQEVSKPVHAARLQYQNTKISDYEHWCRGVLEWLIVFGDLAEMEFIT